MRKKDTRLVIEPAKQEILKMELCGTTDLILHKRHRSFELAQMWKLSHPLGAVPPKHLSDTTHRVWEHLITTITWRDPIVFHDDDFDLYTEDEWKYYMENNAPCILNIAFIKSMGQAFKTFGYKTKLKKDGTDLARAVSPIRTMSPITFATVSPKSKLVPTGGINSADVMMSYNQFSGWKCNLELLLAGDVFPPETVIEVLATTGKFIGVGTQRKEGYGRWEIKNAELIRS